MSEPVGLQCPGCGQPPMLVIDGGHQAFCGNDIDCHVLTWDPTLTLEQLAADANFMPDPFAAGEPG